MEEKMKDFNFPRTMLKEHSLRTLMIIIYAIFVSALELVSLSDHIKFSAWVWFGTILTIDA
jgi:hypothetical protein